MGQVFNEAADQCCGADTEPFDLYTYVVNEFNAAGIPAVVRDEGTRLERVGGPS